MYLVLEFVSKYFLTSRTRILNLRNLLLWFFLVSIFTSVQMIFQKLLLVELACAIKTRKFQFARNWSWFTFFFDVSVAWVPEKMKQLNEGWLAVLVAVQLPEKHREVMRQRVVATTGQGSFYTEPSWFDSLCMNFRITRFQVILRVIDPIILKRSWELRETW